MTATLPPPPPVPAAIRQCLESVAIENGRIVEIFTPADGELCLPGEGYYDKLPPMAIVRLELTPAERSFVRVEVALPEKWNGRFVGTGNGGVGGRLPSGSIYDLAKRGYAAATTDLGTSRPAPYQSGIDNPDVHKDYGYRATHLMTVVGKQLVRARYGRDPEFSYFTGGSTGGQQALSLAQRYPADYDGILAAVPAHCRAPLHAYFLWNYQATHRADNSPLFTREQERRYIQSVLEYFRDRETLEDAKGRYVSEPRWTDADRAAVLALAAERDPTLTPEHIDGLRRLQDGPVHARTGERIFDGIPPATQFGPATGNLYLFNWVFGKDANYMAIDWDRDIDRYFDVLKDSVNAESTDLDAFRARGGKLIAYSGTADSCVPYTATLDYYERVADRLGSFEEAQKFFLFYILPGREHGGGPGVSELRNAFEALVGWREKGIAPKLDAVRRGAPGLKLDLEPYPGKGPRGGVKRVAERFL